MHKSICVVFFFILNAAHAQHTHWLKYAETDNYNYSAGKRIARHPDGSIYVLGYLQGTNTFDGEIIITPGIPSSSDIFLAHYTSEGILLWVKQLIQPVPTDVALYSNRPTDINIDSEGNIIVVGWSFTPGSFLGATPGKGAFIAKMDADANLMWINYESEIGGDADIGRRGSRIAFDENDNIVWFNDQFSYYSQTGGIALTKYAKDGTKLWNKYITYNDNYDHPILTSISIDKNQDIILTLTFFYSINFYGQSFYNNGPNTGNYSMQFVLTKFSSTGDFIWGIQSKNGEASMGSAHTTDGLGNIYVTGTMGYGMQFGNSSRIYNNSVSAKGFIAKVKPNGDVEWVNAFDNASPYDVTKGKDGYLYVTGTFFDAGMRYQSYRALSNTYHQGFVVKLNQGGNFQAGIPSQASLGCLAWQSLADADGNVFTMGDFGDQITFGCLTSDVITSSFFLLKHDFEPHLPDNLSIIGSTEICNQLTTTLQTTVVPGVQYYTWYLPEGVTSVSGTTVTTDTFLQVTITKEADQKDILVSAFVDCLEVFSYPFTLHALPPPGVPTLLLNPPLVCPGSSEVKYAVRADPNTNEYVWTLPTGITGVTNATTDTIRLNLSATFTSGSISVKAKGQCGESNAQNVVIGIFPPPLAPTLIGQPKVCPGTNLTYWVKGDASTEQYVWTFPPGVTGSVNALTDSALLSFPTAFTGAEIMVTAKGRCNQSSDSRMNVEIFPKPGKPIIAGPTMICTNSIDQEWHIVTPVDNALRYQWELPPSLIPNPLFSKDDGTIHIQVFPQFTRGDIRVWAVGQCTNGELSAPFTVSAIPLPGGIPNISGDTKICVVNGVSMPYTASGILNVNQYVWTIPSFFSLKGNTNGTTNMLQLEARQAGEGEIKMYGMNQCKQKSDSTTLAIQSILKPNQPNIEKSPCDLTLTSNERENLEWYKDGVLIAGLMTPNITLSDSGVYYARVYNFCGDERSDDIQAYPVIADQLFLPNIITVNGDGKNDFFKIDNALKNSSLSIFNRWGDPVYHADHYLNNWNGNEEPSGLYYYILKNDCLTSPIKDWLHVID